MKHLCQYFNEETRKLSITYNRTVPILDKTLDNIKFIKFGLKLSKNEEKYINLT